MFDKNTELLFKGLEQTSDTLSKMQTQISNIQQGLAFMLEQLEKMYPEEAKEYKRENGLKE